MIKERILVKLGILSIVLIVMLAGCSRGSSNVTDAGTKVASTETNNMNSDGKNGQQITIAPTSAPTNVPTAIPTVTPTVIATETTKDEFQNLTPISADWSALEKKLTMLEDSNMWGSAYDFRLEDLTSLDLSNESEKMKDIVFDKYTKWTDKLPKGFNPKAVMENGKNPGLGIRSLHKKGITGKGVNIAIIDQPLLLQHKEYCKQVKLYEEGNTNGVASMHGPFVASLAVGKNIGIAPDAGLYFIASFNYNVINDEMELDYTHIAYAIDRLLEINASLPKKQKIRAISMSMSWGPENKGYNEITAAIERAKKEGIFVISCNMFENYGFWTYCLDKEPLSDPEKQESYFPIIGWDNWMNEVAHIKGFPQYYEKKFSEDFKGEMLLIPTGSRTTCEPTGDNAYAFNRLGGWSAMEPYLAGLYAMACQVKPDITPEIFWSTALKTGDLREITRNDKKYPARMINPKALIESLQK